MWRRILSMFKRLYFWTGIVALIVGILSYLSAIILGRTDLAVVGVGAGYIGIRLTFDYFFKLGQRLYKEAKPMFYRRSFQILGAAIIVFLAVTMYTSTRVLTVFTVLQWGTATFMIVGGFGVAAAGYATYWRRNLVLNTPTSSIRSVPIGDVEVKGTARQEDETNYVSGPLTGEPCLGYRYKIQWFDPEEGWRTSAEGQGGLPFFLDDGTGQVRIDPEGARFYLEPEVDVTVRAGDDLPDDLQIETETSVDETDSFEQAQEKLKNHVVSPKEDTTKDYRYIEQRLHPDDDIYVYGTAQRRDDASSATRSTDRLVIGNSVRSFFAISDMPEDELIDALGTHTWKKIGVGLGAIMLGIVGVLWSMGLISIPIMV